MIQRSSSFVVMNPTVDSTITAVLSFHNWDSLDSVPGTLWNTHFNFIYYMELKCVFQSISLDNPVVKNCSSGAISCSIQKTFYNLKQTR